jgi:hypothetical protein
MSQLMSRSTKPAKTIQSRSTSLQKLSKERPASTSFTKKATATVGKPTKKKKVKKDSLAREPTRYSEEDEKENQTPNVEMSRFINQSTPIYQSVASDNMWKYRDHNSSMLDHQALLDMSAISVAPRLVIEQNPSPAPSSSKAASQSAAIAGAMKVLHHKVMALEQENSVLRECFQEI